MLKAFFASLGLMGLVLTGCEGDIDRPGQRGPRVEVKERPDLNPQTDHDVDVKTGDIDVDVHRRPGQLPDVDVDLKRAPDRDTRANETEIPGLDRRDNLDRTNRPLENLRENREERREDRRDAPLAPSLDVDINRTPGAGVDVDINR